jgi:alkylhydroperoxidase family enzyme
MTMVTKDPTPNWLAAQRREREWQRLLAHLRDAPGHLTPTVRRAVFDNDEVPADLAPFVDTVVRYVHRTTDGDVAALVRAGYSEDEVFEAVIVAAAGAADRRLQAVRRATAEA